MIYVNTFYDRSEHYSSLIEKGEQYALRFKTTVPFSGIKYICPIMSANKGIINLSLYKWKDDYETTVKGVSVANTVGDLRKGTDMFFDFPEQEKGEYLFVAHDGTTGVGFCGLMESWDYGTLYINGTPVDGSMEMAIKFDNDCDNYFDKVPTYKELFVTKEPVEEIEYINSRTIDTDQYCAIDGLGRTLPTYDEAGPKKNKSIGLFYWDWHYHYEKSKPVNLENLIAKYPQLKNDYDNEIWKDHMAEAYFWNEPIYGYYTSTDKYVVRKQAELLADAGVDFIVFDCTNGSYTWKLGYDTILEVYAQARADGIKTPQIVFMFNFGVYRSTHVMLRKIYTDIYRREKYKDLWFYYEGKPLVICYKDIFNTKEPLDDEILNFFTFRQNDPFYFTKESPTDDSWGWLSLNPQCKYSQKPDGSFEQMTVGVAQNASEHGLVAMNDYRGGVCGRSYTYNKDYSYSYNKNGKLFTVKHGIENQTYYGLNFSEQWDYAIKSDPDIIFITGYNEWVAGRHKIWQGSENAFPDQYSNEYSRDVEPTKGELKDYYYYQMAENIRRFKGVNKPVKNTAKKTINSLFDWEDVPAVNFYLNNAPKRDNDGWCGTHYINNTARNNPETAKCSIDENYIYFYLKCQNKITEPKEDNWMRLFISNDYTKENWEGFNFYISSYEKKLKSSLGGWNWKDICDVDITVSCDVLTIKIPKEHIGEKFSYKWSDNMQKDGDIMDFYVNGNVAPGARYTIPVVF